MLEMLELLEISGKRIMSYNEAMINKSRPHTRIVRGRNEENREREKEKACQHSNYEQLDPLP